ncbi:MAG: AAA family ATPase [Planctomycetota bacterium]|nr:AAA family ATPase [Planctomycetota bacterium]
MSSVSIKQAELTLFYLAQALQEITPDDKQEVRADFLNAHLRVKYPLFPYVFVNPGECTQIVEHVITSQLPQAVATLGELKGVLLLAPGFEVEPDRYLAENALEIFGRIPLEHLALIENSRHFDKVAHKLGEILRTRQGFDMRRAMRIAEAYKEAVREPWHQVRSKSRLIEILGEYVHLESAEHEPSVVFDDASPSAAIEWYTTAGIFPNRTVQIGMVAVNAESSREKQLELVEGISKSTRADLLVVIAIGDSTGFESQLRTIVSRSDFVCLTDDSLRQIGVAESPERVFRDKLMSSVPLRLVSPYKFSGPVGRDVFFGREVELRRILETQGTNFSIVGARQIGKSSLLHQVRREVNENKLIENTTALYMDASNCRQLEQFCWTLIDAFSPAISEANIGNLVDCVEHGDIQGFLDCLLGVIRRGANRYLLLIDEVDDLLDAQEAVRFERLARTLANEGRVRFVLSGYRRLKQRTNDRASHLFNLVDPINLGPLSEIEARSLVAKPMARIGVRFQGAGTIDLILKAGSTIPWLLQFFCDLLIRQLDKDQNRRVVRADDVAAVAISDKFVSTLLQIVEDSNMPDLERIIIYACAKSGETSVSEATVIDRVRAQLFEASFSEIRGALNYLVDTYVFNRDRSKYSYYIPQLKEAIAHREDDPELVVRELSREFRDARLVNPA